MISVRYSWRFLKLEENIALKVCRTAVRLTVYVIEPEIQAH